MNIGEKQNKTIFPSNVYNLSAEEFNQIVSELQYIIEQSGIVKSASDTTQVLTSLRVIFSGAVIPVGIVIPFAGGGDIPGGWLICDGSAISRTTYTALFNIIGTTYGEGDGSTTFNLPNLSGKFVLGANNIYPLGSVGGEATHILTIDEMPRHNHTLSYHVNGAGGGGAGPNNSGTVYTSDTGGDQAHNNMPPYLSLPYIIKY